LRLAAALSADPFLLASHTLLIIPVANPDGLAANTRHNASGIDLNRNFISDQPCDHPSFGHSLSEPESRFIAQILHDFSPHRILTIHQPLACIDYDGPAQPLAEHMAPFCPIPVKKLGARPCSLGSYAGEMLQIPIITLELTAEDSNLSEPDRWQKYGQCLLSVITYPDSPTLAK
jgi:protein MpaA